MEVPIVGFLLAAIAIVVIFSVRRLLRQAPDEMAQRNKVKTDAEDTDAASFLKSISEIQIVPDPFPVYAYKREDLWRTPDLLEFYRQIAKQSKNIRSPFVRKIGFYPVPKSWSDKSTVAVRFSWEVRPHPDARGEDLSFRVLRRDQDTYVVINEDMPSFPFSKRQDYSR
jgi:hypothetical protein